MNKPVWLEVQQGVNAQNRVTQDFLRIAGRLLQSSFQVGCLEELSSNEQVVFQAARNFPSDFLNFIEREQLPAHLKDLLIDEDPTPTRKGVHYDVDHELLSMIDSFRREVRSLNEKVDLISSRQESIILLLMSNGNGRRSSGSGSDGSSKSLPNSGFRRLSRVQTIDRRGST